MVIFLGIHHAEMMGVEAITKPWDELLKCLAITHPLVVKYTG